MALDGQVGIVWHGMVMVQCGMASLVSLAGLGVKTAQRRSVPILMLISQLSSHRHTAQKIQIQTRSNIWCYMNLCSRHSIWILQKSTSFGTVPVCVPLYLENVHCISLVVSALGIMMEMAHICISSAAPLAAGGIVPYITTLVMVMTIYIL